MTRNDERPVPEGVASVERRPAGARPARTPSLAAPEDPGLSGILLVDKPDGPTSHDVIASLRRSLGIRRCGHAGTLDPFASGLLVVGIGRATRLLRFLSASDKTYEGIIRLGLETETDDGTGAPRGEARPVRYSPRDLERCLMALSGSFEQISPDYSARKHEGVPHYRLARRRSPIPKRPSRVDVQWHACEPVAEAAAADGGPAPSLLRIRVTVSAGTYIRALARDLGAALGCGGHLASLRRLRSGPFRVEEALSPGAPPPGLRDAILPLEAIPLALPSVEIEENAVAKIRSGAAIPWPGPEPAPHALDVPGAGDEGVSFQAPPGGAWVRLLSRSGSLIALAQVRAESPEGPIPPPFPPWLQPRIVL